MAEQGSYGAVYRGVHRETGRVYAIKIVEDLTDDIKKEIDIMQQCECPEIVAYHGSYRVNGMLWVGETLALQCSSLAGLCTFGVLSNTRFVCH